MRVIVIGSGKLGYRIAEALSAENYDVVVIDNDSEVIDRINESLDVLSTCANGLLAEPLNELRLTSHDLVIAVTGSDEGNILACMSAKSLGAGRTIARIRNPEYSRHLAISQKQLCIDHIINPDRLAAAQITDLLTFTPAKQIQKFVDGKVQLAEIGLPAGSPLLHRPLKEQKFPGVLIAAVSRQGQIIIPKGDDRLLPGDDVFVVGQAPAVASFCRRAGKELYKIRSAMVLGGGRITDYLAQDLQSAGIRVKIIEKDPVRAQILSVNLPHALIVQGDGTDMELLISEDIDATDAFVALTGIDEENMVVCLLAKKLGVKKAIAKVNRKGYASIADEIGIDSVVTPGLTALAEVLRIVRGGEAVALTLLLGGQAEVMEFCLGSDWALNGKAIKDIGFPREAIITAIVRGGQVIIPKGDDLLLAQDRIIVLARLTKIGHIKELFGDERKVKRELWGSLPGSGLFIDY